MRQRVQAEQQRPSSIPKKMMVEAGEHEARVVDALCQPWGARPAPPKDVLAQFVVVSRSLDAYLVCALLEEKLEEELTPLRKMQRGVRAIQFAHRLGKSAEQKESLDDVMVEVAEAVAQHWLDVRLHYIAVVMGYLTGVFLVLGFVVTASGRA